MTIIPVAMYLCAGLMLAETWKRLVFQEAVWIYAAFIVGSIAALMNAIYGTINAEALDSSGRRWLVANYLLFGFPFFLYFLQWAVPMLVTFYKEANQAL